MGNRRLNKTFRARFLTRTSRFKRHAGNISREVTGSLLLVFSICLITSVLIYGYKAVIDSSYFLIKQTTVIGCKEVTEKDILTMAAVKQSQSILSLNVKTMAERIRSNPWIKEVSIGREFPDRLVIRVKEKTPVAVVHKEQAFFLLDEEGAAFKKVETPDEADLPIMTGYYNEGRENRQLIIKTIQLLKYLASVKTFPSLNNISEIHGNDVMGISIFTNKGFCLNLGFDEYENKLRRLDAVMADLEKNNQKLNYASIDLSDPTKITIQRKSVSANDEPSETAQGYSI